MTKAFSILVCTLVFFLVLPGCTFTLRMELELEPAVLTQLPIGAPASLPPLAGAPPLATP